MRQEGCINEQCKGKRRKRRRVHACREWGAMQPTLKRMVLACT